MNFSSRDWLAIFACAVLIVTAVLLPVAFLHPPKIAPIENSRPFDASRLIATPSPAEPTPPPAETKPPAVIKPDVTAETDESSKPDEPIDNYGPGRGELFGNIQARKPVNLSDLSSSVQTNFTFPKDAELHANKIFGIDIYHGSDDQCGKQDSCKIDWKAVANQKVSFVYVKASQGNNPLPDEDFVRHWQSLAKQRSVMRGAYHFLSATTGPEEGAKSFVDKVMKAGGFSPRDLPPAMDLEWDKRDKGRGPDQWRGQSADRIIDKALIWLKYVKEKTGRTPLIYTSRAWWTENNMDLKKIERLKDYPIWIADYALEDQRLETPKMPAGWTWKLWQFTACGGLPGAGIRSRVDEKRSCSDSVESLDVSFYPGTMSEFRKTFEIMAPAANDRIAHANDIVTPIEDPRQREGLADANFTVAQMDEPRKRDGSADENVIIARLEVPQTDSGIPDKIEEISDAEQPQAENDNALTGPLMEIDFSNGRKLRISVNVDPAILMRIVKVLDSAAPTGDAQ